MNTNLCLLHLLRNHGFNTILKIYEVNQIIEYITELWKGNNLQNKILANH